MMRSRMLFLAALLAAPATFAQVTTDGPFQVRYVTKLNIGDSVVNITNTGATGAGLTAGTSASITGAICANVYAFAPTEEMVSCCSCPVTPNGLVSLSARNDLISNTLTPAVPNSIVIKILATAPVAGSCNRSAAAVTTATIVPGLAAWATTTHSIQHLTATNITYGITETAFTPATLSAGELSRLGNLCNFIIANGGGFGICRSCRLGGLAAVQ